MHGADGGKMRDILYEEVSKEMKVLNGELDREAVDMNDAVPGQYEETEEEKAMGTKTFQNMKMLKKTLLVGGIMKN